MKQSKTKTMNRETVSYLVSFNPHKNAAGAHVSKREKDMSRKNKKKILANALRGVFICIGIQEGRRETQ